MTSPLHDLLDRGVDVSSLPVRVDERLRVACWVSFLPLVLLGWLVCVGSTPTWLPALPTLRGLTMAALGGVSLGVWTRGFRRAGRLLHVALVGLVLSAAVAASTVPFVLVSTALA